ncbi:ABC transporter permease subunit [Deinococcus planocerae]|uniref:ABC transporter permease subunit n=1 Tax=Deinococcus planocerae TaxID=1737569 RepID=UPI000C7F40EF|nr:ABC transporter permease subunit [Deinococcus planocerae]
MHWNYILRIVGKELRSSLRDRRTLMASVFLPLAMIPLFLIGFPLLIQNTAQSTANERQVVGVLHLGRLPAALRSALTADTAQGKGVLLVPTNEGLGAVRDGDLDVVIDLPENLPAVAGGASVPIRIYAKLSNQKTRLVVGKVTDAIEAYNRTLVTARLRQAGLGPQTLQPVVGQPVNAATLAEQRSGPFAFMIPYLLTLWLLTGGQAPAIDATAGEKERGTLEALLVTPVSRLDVVIGKFIGVMIFAVTASVFTILGLAVASAVARQVLGHGEVAQAFGVNLDLGPQGMLALSLGTLSTAALLASVLLALGIVARSFREAQTYVAPLALLIAVPAISLQFADFLTRDPSLYAVPLVGSMLVILDIVRGAWQAQAVALAVLANVLTAALVVVLAWLSFRRERVLFRN